MIALTAIAGGLGALLRFVLDTAVTRVGARRFPLGTLVINVTGSFALGLVVGWGSDALTSDAALVVGTGLLGGYTTFSAASVEAVNLARPGNWRAALTAAVHAGAMLVLGLVAARCGLLLA